MKTVGNFFVKTSRILNFFGALVAIVYMTMSVAFMHASIFKALIATALLTVPIFLLGFILGIIGRKIVASKSAS